MNVNNKHLWKIRHRPSFARKVENHIITPIAMYLDSKVKKKLYSEVKMINNTATVKLANMKHPKKLTRIYLL